MREIKFKYIFKGLPFSSADAGFNWHVKIFTLDRIEAGVICLSNLYHLGELVAKLQFTGLTDANLVEIYEGDIVSDHNGVGVVKYSDKRAAYRVVYGDGTAKWFMDYNLRGERESIKVIGNIHMDFGILNKNQ